MNKIIKKFLSSLLIVAILFGIVPVIAQEKGDLENPVNYVGDNEVEGGVKLTKTLSVLDKEKGIYNVKIDVISKNATTTNTVANPVYVVVVFDTSGSMWNGFISGGDKWDNAVNGAITFSSELLKKISDANIALINFSSSASIVRGFASEVLEKSDFNSPRGGTNIAKGLEEAHNLLNQVNEQNAKKYIVLMSDGEPQVYTSVSTDTKAMNEAISAALAVKDDNIELYAVGYETNTNASNFLKQIVTTPNTKYYTDGKVENIVKTFNHLASEISSFPAGSNAIVTDVLPNNFSYVEDSKSEGVEVNGKTITYEISTLTEEQKTFSFNIIIDPKSNTGWHNTNSATYLTYTDYMNEEQIIELENFSRVYWEIVKYNYTINYYQDTIHADNLIASITDSDDYNREIHIDTSYKIPEGYHYQGEIDSVVLDEDNKIIDILYTKKTDLSYCVDYFYDGIVDINNRECYEGITYGEEITSFIDKPRDGYVYDNFEPITIVDGDNVMNVYYKKVEEGEIVPPITGIATDHNVN